MGSTCPQEVQTDQDRARQRTTSNTHQEIDVGTTYNEDSSTDDCTWLCESGRSLSEKLFELHDTYLKGAQDRLHLASTLRESVKNIVMANGDKLGNVIIHGIDMYGSTANLLSHPDHSSVDLSLQLTLPESDSPSDIMMNVLEILKVAFETSEFVVSELVRHASAPVLKLTHDHMEVGTQYYLY